MVNVMETKETLLCLSDQLKKNTNKSRFPKAHTGVEAIFYRADIANELNINPEKAFIGLRHFNKLFAQFDPKKPQTVLHMCFDIWTNACEYQATWVNQL